MKKVMTHGTYDLLHYGHMLYLKKAKEQGDYLVVLVTSDELAKKYGKSPYYDENIRAFMVGATKYVDEVKVRNQDITKEDVLNNQVDVFVASSAEKGVFDFLNSVCEVKYIDRTKGISTSKIKDDIVKGANNDVIR